MKRKKILITGADGFIGSHFTEHMVRLGYDVRAFVMYNSFDSWGWLDSLNKEVLSNIEIFAGDIRDQDCVLAAAKTCDEIVHLAALIAIPYSYIAPDSYLQTNIIGTKNVVQAARKWECCKVVCTSTSEVYGTAQFVPITEKHPLQPQSPYSASKIGADNMALSFFHSFDTPVAIARPFNTYGPRQSARAVLPTIILQFLAGKNKIMLGNIKATRDFNFVADTVRGLLAVLESESSVGQVINLGGSYECSIKESVEMIAKIMNLDFEIEEDRLRLRPSGSEVERLWASNAKAYELLKWKPLHLGKPGFNDGLKETIKWFSQNKHLYKENRYVK